MTYYRNISVIGAGTMGNGIAHVFAQNGFKVNLIDISLAQLIKAIDNIAKNFDRQIAKGTASPKNKKNQHWPISPLITDLAEGVKECELVVEAATENTELKLKIFRNNWMKLRLPKMLSLLPILLLFPLQKLQLLPTAG